MNSKCFLESIEWLEESLRLLESIKDIESSVGRKANISQVLRMIATCKAELGDLELALKAIEMARTVLSTDPLNT